MTMVFSAGCSRIVKTYFLPSTSIISLSPVPRVKFVTDVDFWVASLDVIRDRIDDYERLATDVGLLTR